MKTIKEYVKNIHVFEEQEFEFKFKLNRDNPESWIKTIVAFANETGGKMFIGVNNDGIAVGFDSSEVDNEQKYFVDFLTALALFGYAVKVEVPLFEMKVLMTSLLCLLR